MRIWLCAVLVLAAATELSQAASRAENAAFMNAAKAFQDGIWVRAEGAMSEFTREFPESPRRAEALLIQAQARCKLGDYAGAIQLLESERAAAAALADQYVFWIGEAQYESTNYPAAAAAFRSVVEDFPASHLRLEASVNEAACHARLHDWPRVVALLSPPSGAFQQLAQTNRTSETFARGVLLLAEAQLVANDFAAAEGAVRSHDGQGLTPNLAWRREFLLCRALLGSRQTEPALATASNLVALAQATGQPALRAQSYALQAAALEELGRLENASATFAQNLTTNAPVELQRQALLKVGELALARGRLTEAAQALSDFLQQHPESPACDMALLSLGELQLKQHLATSTPPGSTNAASTNFLQQALASFDALRARFPASALTGKAELNRGWCLALSGKTDESATAFATAVATLPESFDLAVARFKWGDSLYQQSQFPAALTNYQAVVALADKLPAVRTNLCEQALYQTVRAGIEAGDMTLASEAVGKLLAWFPESHLTAPGLQLAGQGLARHGDPPAARRVFNDLVRRFPGSPREAEVRLAVARTYELEGNWTNAVQEYQAWLAAFPTNAAGPRAEHDLAWATYQAGDETGALTQFTNFLALRPTHPLAPRARWWVADHYFRRGGSQFADAERNYQLLYQTWPTNDLASEARMMAARAAVARQAWGDAIGYFTNLISLLPDTNPLKAQAIFGYGDALRRLPSANTNTPLANFEEAIRVFAKVTDLNPTNAAAARAWGEIGDCSLQLAAQDPRHYAAASNAFRLATEMPAADVPTRNQARIGMGLVAERLAEQRSGGEKAALLKLALDSYLDVFYEERERSDPFWLKRAGLDAVRLAETLQQWPQAVRLLERLRDLLPPLQPTLDKRLEKARDRATVP